MSVFSISDLHLSLAADKPMDQFAGWNDYVKKIEINWKMTVEERDTVIIPGDISWGMSLEEAEADFTFINNLPGTKYLLKGNHDYWWSSMTKMQAFLKTKGLTSIKLLHNNCAAVESIAVCGTRGWMLEEISAHDVKLTAREAGRLESSLKAGVATGLEPVVFLHYPPVFGDQISGDMIDVMRQFGVKQCFYGHIHGSSGRYAFQGEYLGIDFRLVSADSMNFTPALIKQKISFP